MKLSVDRDLPVPLGVQLRGLIEYGIACGELSPGARLPSVRELADELGVAPMTVSQVYRELKDGGLIEARSGLGTFVTRQSAGPRSASIRASPPAAPAGWPDRGCAGARARSGRARPR